MSLSTEQTFRNAVQAAESTRQQSKAAARVTYGFNPSNLAAYLVALNDADVAYVTSVNSAANTLDEQIGNVGLSGPIDGAAWTPMLAIA